jgi:dolichol-phosphate mannosyltransferase
MDAAPKLLSILIPCYNEAATIAEVVTKVEAVALPTGWGKEIIIIDDGSGSETLAVLRTLEMRVRVIYQPQNGGKGAAVKAGLEQTTGDYCIIQDADLELDPSDISALAAPIAAGIVEVVCGYRVLAEEHAPVSPTLFYGGRLLTAFFNLAFGTSFKDIPACYKMFPRSVIPKLLATPSNDFVFDAIELTYVLTRIGRMAQVPIHYYPRSRAQGKKLRLEHGIQSAVAIVLLRLGLHHSPIAKEMGRIARFLISGVATVLVNLLTLYIFTEYARVWYLASSVIAFCVSYGVNFTLQKFWTFKHRDINAITYQLPLHFALALGNLALNTAILYALVQWLGVWYVLAQVIAAFVIALDSFFLSRKIFSHP